ncbi:MAG: hypothetical protein LBD94_02270, partial [Rickettsiales bacterium]|nr:hypothetical protein [Rickettsiales bacterium]
MAKKATLSEQLAKEGIFRLRSKISDKNDQILTIIQLNVLIEMGLVKQSDVKADDKYSNLLDLLDKKLGDLNKNQKNKFSGRYFDTLSEENLTDLVPPSILCDAYEYYKSQNDDDKAGKIAKQMDSLSDQMAAQGTGYFFSDVTNIFDCYDGYKRMFEIRSKELGDDDPKKAQTIKNLPGLEFYITEYDNIWNLNIADEDKKDLQEKYDRLKEIIDSIGVDNLGEILRKFVFRDKDGKKIDQFDDKGNLLPNSR